MISIIIFNILIYLIGILSIVFNGGFRKNILLSLSWSIFIIYYFLTPLYFYSQGRSTIFGQKGAYHGLGTVILEYYDEGFLYYGIANLLLLLGYWILPVKSNASSQEDLHPETFKNAHNWIRYLYFSCVLIVIGNLIASGINPLDVIFGETGDASLFGAQTASNYLRNFADSIITCILLAAYFKLPRKQLIVGVLFSFFLFALMGFRYRIIVSLMGLIFIYLFRNKISIAKVLPTLFGGLTILYFILFITVNRYNLIFGRYSNLQYNVVKFKPERIIAEQTRGMLDDITIIKYYETTPNAYHDNGITFFYFLVRAVPRSIAGEWKDRMYPPPAFNAIRYAYKLPRAWGTQGEAPLHYAYFMIAGGLPFLFIGAFFIGLGLRYIRFTFPIGKDSGVVFQIVLCTVLFQWYTRGYFPQMVDMFAFLMVPYVLFFKFAREKIPITTQENHRLNA